MVMDEIDTCIIITIMKCVVSKDKSVLLRGSWIQKPGVHLAFYLKYYHHNGNTRQKHEE